MKKTLLIILVLAIFTSQFFSSCRMTENVVSSDILQKRKYQKGYYVNLFSAHRNVKKRINNIAIIRSDNSKTNDDEIFEPKNKEFKSSDICDFSSSVENTAVEQTHNSATAEGEKQTSKMNKSEVQNLVVFSYDPGEILKNKYQNNIPAPKPEDDPKPNKLSIFGFVFSLLGLALPFIIGVFAAHSLAIPISAIGCLLLAIILSTMGMIKTNKGSDKWIDDKFAIAGLVISATVAFFTLLLLLYSQMFTGIK